MPIRHLITPPILLVRWVERCRAADIDAIVEHLDEAAIAAAQEGEDLIYIAIIPVDCAPPDSEARAALREGTLRATEVCRSVHIVIEGQGLRRALIRSISAGLLLATRNSNGFRIHENLQLALDSAGLTHGQRSAFIEAANASNMLS
jgi:hypothetical protein